MNPALRADRSTNNMAKIRGVGSREGRGGEEETDKGASFALVLSSAKLASPSATGGGTLLAATASRASMVRAKAESEAEAGEVKP